MMRDVMQNAGLHNFAELAVLIFFFAFLAVAAQVFLSRRGRYEEHAKLPLEPQSLEDGVEVSQ